MGKGTGLYLVGLEFPDNDYDQWITNDLDDFFKNHPIGKTFDRDDCFMWELESDNFHIKQTEGVVIDNGGVTHLENCIRKN